MTDQRTNDYAASLERAVLGLMLLEPTLVLRVERTLEPDDFENDRHRRIFEVLVTLGRSGRDTSAGAAAIELRRHGGWDETDDRYLGVLVSDPGAADPRVLDERVKLLREEGRRRAADRAARAFAGQARDRSVSLGDSIGELRRTLGELEAAEGEEELPAISHSVDEVLRTLETGIDPGTPTGMPNLDMAIQGGIKNSQLIVVAGSTGSGKTSLATQIALLAAQWAAKRPTERGAVLIFSLEMNALELTTRMVAQVTRIEDGYRPPSGFSRRDQVKVRDALARIRLLPIHVEVPRRSTVEAIRAATERFMGVHGKPSLVIVDHIGLLKDPKVRGGRTEEVGSITRSLKEMGMQLDLPLLALSQLNRESGKRDDHRPQLTDLRESGCLTGDTMVHLADGSRKPIGELVGASGFEVPAIDTETWKLEPRRVTAAFSTGMKPVFAMTTRTGRTIRATANHKFLTISGWDRLDALGPGSRIAISRHDPFADSDVDWDEVISIEPDGVEEVFDLTVERLHSFVAGDVIVHNSVEQDANAVLLVYRPSYFLKDLEERRRLEEAGAEAYVYVAKNRSGPTSEVRFDWIGPRYLFRVPPDWAQSQGLVDPEGTRGLIEEHVLATDDTGLAAVPVAVASRPEPTIADVPPPPPLPDDDNPFA